MERRRRLRRPGDFGIGVVLVLLGSLARAQIERVSAGEAAVPAVPRFAVPAAALTPAVLMPAASAPLSPSALAPSAVAPALAPALAPAPFAAAAAGPTASAAPGAAAKPRNLSSRSSKAVRVLDETLQKDGAAFFDGAAPKNLASQDVVRVVLKGAPKPAAASQILADTLKRWPAGLHARFLVLPGGFAEAPWPKEWKGRSGWTSRPEDIQKLIAASAKKELPRILSPAVLKAAKGKIDYITLGIDVLSENGLADAHAELVVVYNVKTGKTAWTGKSFPTAAQEEKLVQVSDLNTHFLEIDGRRVMILGCNDLNLFSPRVAAVADPDGLRGQMVRRMAAAVRRHKPDVVLQHPHATDSPNIWRNSWVRLTRLFPSVQVWGSAIRYANPLVAPRKPLAKVLAQTRSETGVADVVVDTARYPSAPSRYLKGLKKF
ncbi:MAG: hypothetical protein ACHQ49_15120 [Elusimicrobiota bacterium]